MNSKKTVWVFGNPDVQIDSLPIKLMRQLPKKFPDLKFEVKDPQEEWRFPETELIILDTVINIPDVKVFENIEDFSLPESLTMHDFDLSFQLNFLKKLGKLPPKIKIVGIPPTIGLEEALKKLGIIFQSI